jgi:hypothetical protein
MPRKVVRKAEATPGKTGPKPLWRPEYADMARRFCLLGATNDDLAGCFEVSTATISHWMAGKPEFAKAVKSGREIADSIVAEKLWSIANGYSHKAEKIMQFQGEVIRVEYTEHYPPNAVACIFWLKNRQRGKWKDRFDHDVRKITSIQDLTDEELEALAGMRSSQGNNPPLIEHDPQDDDE